MTMTADSVFNLYLDANLVLALAVSIWALARGVIARSSLRNAHMTQLRGVYGVMIAAFAVMPLWAGLAAMQGAGQGGWQAGAGHRLSDIAVAQYLEGHIAMPAAQFAEMLGLRAALTEQVSGLSSVAGVGIAAFLAVGLILALVRLVRSAVQLRGLIARSYGWRRIGVVRLHVSDEVHVPFSTRGLNGYHIVLPSSLLTRAPDLRIAVAHELQHVRQGDLEWALVIEALRPLFFWNPAFAVWRGEVERLRELACDTQVLARGPIRVRAYCDCLLRVSVAARRGERHLIDMPAVTLVPGRVGQPGGRAARLLERRVLSMVAGVRGRAHRLAGMVLNLSLALAVLTASLALQPAGDWSHDRLMLSTIVNLERLEQRSAVYAPSGW